MDNEFYDEDLEPWESDKFDECWTCKHRFCELTCSGCGYGEEFEEEDLDEVDKDFIL
jgi:hypothetical protein